MRPLTRERRAHEKFLNKGELLDIGFGSGEARVVTSGWEAVEVGEHVG